MAEDAPEIWESKDSHSHFSGQGSDTPGCASGRGVTIGCRGHCRWPDRVAD